jgi:hypothetical protein
MADVEILGRPQYRSRKAQEKEVENQSIHKEPKRHLSDLYLEYEQYERDWWWCDDV